MSCIFCQIANRQIPKEFILETSQVMVFPDIQPAAPIHLLIVSKKHIQEFGNLRREDQKIWENMIEILHKLIKEYDLTKKGYRIISNGGGAQAIDHFHIHLLGKISKEREI